MNIRRIRTALLALSCALAGTAAQAQDAATLRAKSESLQPALRASPFGRPLVLESRQASGDLAGEVYAIVDQPFELAAPALQGADRWCELLILHLNVKHCGHSGQTLSLVVGRKTEQTRDEGYAVDFAYSVPAAGSDYLRVQMAAGSGPMGTRDYRLVLELVPLDAKRSFAHMSYAYAYGTVARLAMQAYLATTGRDKVGFSVMGRNANGQPVYVDGVRGVLERNTMRYYLAIQAYLDAVPAPAAQREEKRLNAWFDATERYALQLHEIDRADYLAMKRNELQRQRVALR